jgi:hypothetical protein
MWAILFSGKFETEHKDEFLQGLEDLIKRTNTKVFGSFAYQQFVDFLEVEDSEVQVIDENAEKESSGTSNISSEC